MCTAYGTPLGLNGGLSGHAARVTHPLRARQVLATGNPFLPRAHVWSHAEFAADRFTSDGATAGSILAPSGRHEPFAVAAAVAAIRWVRVQVDTGSTAKRSRLWADAIAVEAGEVRRADLLAVAAGCDRIRIAADATAAKPARAIGILDAPTTQIAWRAAATAIDIGLVAVEESVTAR